MCHAFLTDANFYQLLFQIDGWIAEEVRARGCDCGGQLHSACYPRKPRGIRSALDESYQSRLSFCCAQDGCRRRSTPPQSQPRSRTSSAIDSSIRNSSW